MTTTGRSVVVGVFEDPADAESAIQDLQSRGFAEEEIGYAVRRGGAAGAAGTALADAGSAAPGGAATGALTGGLLGGLIGAAAALLVPGIGPVVAGGVLASALGGLAIGAAAGGLLGALVGMGVPEEEARYYEAEFQSGRAIVTVRAGGRYLEAQQVLRAYGAYGTPDDKLPPLSPTAVGATTGSVDSENAGTGPALAAVPEDEHREAGTTLPIGDQARIAQSSAQAGTDSGVRRDGAGPRTTDRS